MSGRKRVIGVMGGGRVTPDVEAKAEVLGEAVAREGWVILTGGDQAGVMGGASRGAHRAGGLVVGILPHNGDGNLADDIDVAIFTGIGDARNAVNVFSSDVVVALEGGMGTLSEIALALDCGRPVVLHGFDDRGLLNVERERARVVDAENVDDVVAAIKRLLA